MIDFNKLVEHYLHREFRPKQIGWYYPSEIGSCLRRVWFSYTKPKETEPDLVKIFHAGNILHDFVVDVLRSEKTKEIELIASEFPFRVAMKDFMVSGRVDNLILIKVENKKVLVEVKSCSSLNYTVKPAKSHLAQLQFYMKNVGVYDGILLYIEKNTLKSKVFPVTYDEKETEKISERFTALHESLIKNNMPDPEARMLKDMIWMCKNCPYGEECYKETPSDILP